MYITAVPNRNSEPTYLLRESFRDADGKVKNRTLANLSKLPLTQIQAIRRILKGEDLVPADEAMKIIRSLPHGHVAAVLGTLKQLKVDTLLGSRQCKERDRIVALIVARVLFPASKLATVRGLQKATCTNTLAESLQLGSLDEDDLYEAMDWLVQRQGKIEQKLAQRHLQDGTLVLYDLSSSYYTGSHCPLAKYGHNRDGKKGFPQIVYGLLCNKEGCPVAIEVFEGNTADPKTVSSQIDKIRKRFKLSRVVLVGDRGVLTQARIREDLMTTQGIDWVSALRAPAIRKLAEQGDITKSLFDECDLAEITSSLYPNERLMVCLNPLLADERGRKRSELLQATEKQLDKIVQATTRKTNPLRGKAEIGKRVGKVLNRFKVGKHFELKITAQSFSYQRKEDKIAAEAALDGIYVIRTSVDQMTLTSEQTVLAYKRLSTVERAFRSLKTVDLKIRPIYHRLPNRVRAHVFLCMLAYYVEWHMRGKLASILFDDDDKQAAATHRSSPVAPAQVSDKAKNKADRKRTPDGLPVHSFRTLLDDLATLTKNRVQVAGQNDGAEFDMLTTPTEVQAKAFELLGLRL